MAKFTLTNAVVMINSVDLSDHAFQVDVKLERDKVEVTGFNSAGSKDFLPGSKDEEVTVSFRQDFASAKVDATLWPLYNNGTTFPISISAVAGGNSSTNPAYTASSAALYEYHPVNGSFGDASDTQVTFSIIGGISRATS